MGIFSNASGNSAYRITPNTNLRNIKKNIGKSARAKKRESEKRRRRLERLARWTSGKEVRVYFQKEGAKCQKASANASHDLEVYVPTAEHDQPATNLEPAVWDFVFQKAELIHELGHVLYTDFDAMEEYIEKISDLHGKQIFRRLFNLVEDGAIERQLAADLNVGNDLRIKNENLMIQGEPGRTAKGGEQRLDFHHAIECILMDWAKFNTGRAEKLLDPRNGEYVFGDDDVREHIKSLLPLLRELVSKVVSEPDGARRVEITYEYFRELEDHFEHEGAMTEDDALMQLMKAFPNDGEIYVVMPGGDPPDDAEALEPDEDDTVIFLEPPEGEGEESEDAEREAMQQYGEQVEADDEGEDDESEELGKWAESVERNDTELRVIQSGDLNEETWSKAQRYAKSYKKALKRALQAERESKQKHGQRAGRPDPQSLWQLGYGNSRVFTNERDPEDKDYSVVILLDRSGSMGGDPGADWIVDEAEAVTAGLSLALEELGAEVSIISAGGQVFLEKSFAASTESKKDIICRDESDGGTPIGSALELANDRLQGRDGEKLVFSITDGWPSDEHVYNEALEKSTHPIVGAYFGPDIPDIDDVREYYHRITTSDKEGLKHQVEAMIKRLMV